MLIGPRSNFSSAWPDAIVACSGLAALTPARPEALVALVFLGCSAKDDGDDVGQPTCEREWDRSAGLLMATQAATSSLAEAAPPR